MPDLWPAELATSEETPPVAILHEQAQHLTTRTKGVIEGKVTTTKKSVSDRDLFLQDFFLVVPSLDGYSYKFLNATHDISLYPVTINCFANGQGVKCDNPDAFMTALAELFAHPKTLKVIGALLVQAKVG